jgi:hypothetical protein
MYCPPSPVPPCHPNRRPGPSPPAYPLVTVTTLRTLHGNTLQTYSAQRPNPNTVTLTGISVSFDGYLTLTGADGAFDDLERATQMLLDGLGGLDGWRSIVVDVDANTITIEPYHSCGRTVYATDELGQIVTDELGNLLTISTGCVAPGTYTVDITATIGRTHTDSCTRSVPPDTYFRECQADADAYALEKATEAAEACIAEDTALLYRNSEMAHTAYCPVGLFGSSSSTVAYNTYTSEISQRDADNKARTAAIAEAVSSLICSTEEEAGPCSWSGEQLSVTSGSTFAGSRSSSASGLNFSLEISGQITGTTAEPFNTAEVERYLEFTKDPGGISGTIEFDVAFMQKTAGAGFVAFGWTIEEDGVVTDTDIRPTASFGPGTYSIPYSISPGTVTVRITVGAACYSPKTGGDATGEVSLTGSITGTPCS